MSCRSGQRHRCGPACRRGAALLQIGGAKKKAISVLCSGGVSAGWVHRQLQSPPKATRCPGCCTSFTCLWVLPGWEGSDSRCQEGLGPQDVGRGYVASCTAPRVPPSSAQPVEVSSAGAAAASHCLFLQRCLLCGSVLAEVTFLPSHLVHHAGRWDEVTVKLLREVSLNAMLENITVGGNLFVIVN